MQRIFSPMFLTALKRSVATTAALIRYGDRQDKFLGRLFLMLAGLALVPVFAAGQVAQSLPIGNAPVPVPPINANLYGVSTQASDNSLAMQAAIQAIVVAAI